MATVPATLRSVRDSGTADAGRDARAAARGAARGHRAPTAAAAPRWIDRHRHYDESVCRLLRFIVEPGARVLNVRCHTGQFLDAVSPSHGVGVETNQALVDVARARHPRLTFVQSDVELLELRGRFDYVLVGELADTADVVTSFRRLLPLCEAHARIVIYGYSRLWQRMFERAGRRGLIPLAPNRLSEHEICALLRAAGLQVVRAHRLTLIPKRIPFVSEFVNRVVARLPLVSRLCMASVIVARPEPATVPAETVSVSVIVPCRNERGNVAATAARMPHLGRHTEILFCDDRSTDGTADEIRRTIARHGDRDIRLIESAGVGKAQNVWAGFRASRGDILIILDGDLTVMPEELPEFVRALTEGRAELANGSRLLWAMPRAAMSPSHVAGNAMMSSMFSYLLGHRVTDTLCGTKALWRRDWQRIETHVGSWGVDDRWGDHELLLGAARLQLVVADVPVHYRARVYGVSKMVRIPSTLLTMLRMCAVAAWRLPTGS